MRYFTPERVLMIAVVLSLISTDGIYRAFLQWKDERIGKRLFYFYVGMLVLGSTMAWVGFFKVWL